VQPEASTRLINTFFDSGKVDDLLYHPETVDFMPAWTFGDVAKVFVALALALAAVTVLSLVWTAWWVHKRGRFGGTSAVLRSAYPIILGVGGWLLGALIVLATMPSVPVDDELLAPVGRLARRPWFLPGLSAPGLGEPEEGPRGSRPQSLARS
jgi:hypothetical protein